MKKLLSSTLAVALALSLAIGLTSLSGNKVEAKAKKHKKLTKIEKELKTAKGEPLQQTIDIVTKHNYKAKYYNQGEDATDYIDAIADDMITVKTKVNKKNKSFLHSFTPILKSRKWLLPMFKSCFRSNFLAK